MTGIDKLRYVLYLRREDTIFTILSIGQPITTTIAGEWLNCLIFLLFLLSL